LWPRARVRRRVSAPGRRAAWFSHQPAGLPRRGRGCLPWRLWNIGGWSHKSAAPRVGESDVPWRRWFVEATTARHQAQGRDRQDARPAGKRTSSSPTTTTKSHSMPFYGVLKMSLMIFMAWPDTTAKRTIERCAPRKVIHGGGGKRALPRRVPDKRRAAARGAASTGKAGGRGPSRPV
jgi:hypothetical protein